MFITVVAKNGEYFVNANNIIFIDEPTEYFQFCTVYMSGGEDYSFIILLEEKTRIIELLTNNGKVLTNG